MGNVPNLPHLICVEGRAQCQVAALWGRRRSRGEERKGGGKRGGKRGGGGKRKDPAPPRRYRGGRRRKLKVTWRVAGVQGCTAGVQLALGHKYVIRHRIVLLVLVHSYVCHVCATRHLL